MMGSEGEQPMGAEESRGSGSTDYAEMLVDAKREAAAGGGSKLPSPEEVSGILNRADRAEVTEGIERENLQSLSLLESGTNNTGVDNAEFARSQLLVTLYDVRRHTLDRTAYDNEGNTLSAQTSEQLMKDALREADMWERIVKGEPVTAVEESLVRGRALSIRKIAAAEKAGFSR